MRELIQPKSVEAETPAEIQARIRAAVHAAAVRGDAWGAVEVVLESPLLGGIPRQLDRKYSGLGWAAAQDVFAEAVDAMVQAINAGIHIEKPDGWLWRVASRRAVDELRQRRDSARLRPNMASVEPEEQTVPVSRDVLRREALRLAREMLPRIKQERPRDVLALILDGIEAGHEVSNADVAERLSISLGNARVLRGRAFERLTAALDEAGVELTLADALRIEDQELEEEEGR